MQQTNVTNMEFPLKIQYINRAIKFRPASPRWSSSINKNHFPCQREFHKAEITLRQAETDTSVHEYLLPYARYQVRDFITWAMKHYSTYLFIFLSFVFFRAALVAYGGSQARGLVGATASSLHQSHSNARSEPHLRPTPQFMAALDP